MSEGYQSEHASPHYSVVSRRLEGTIVTTTVILDGELVEFQAAKTTVEAAAALALKGATHDE